MRKQTRKKNKQINNKKKTKAKGQTRNLRETRFLIKNINFNNQSLPPDVAKKITSNYLSNTVVSRIHQYNRRNLIIEKLKNYINIITFITNEIHNSYPDEDLNDLYDYINNKEVLNDLLKEIKKQAKKDVSEKYMDSIEKKLRDYYIEINQVFEGEIEKAQYGNNRLLSELDRFLQSN